MARTKLKEMKEMKEMKLFDQEVHRLEQRIETASTKDEAVRWTLSWARLLTEGGQG